MGKYFAVQHEGRGIFLARDFRSEEEAGAFMSENGISGVLTTAEDFAESDHQKGVDLNNAKTRKVWELKAEALVRLKEIDPLIQDFNTVYANSAMGANRSPRGDKLAGIATAAGEDAARIRGLQGTKEVREHNVKTRPSWPRRQGEPRQ